jgi:hypothetical protein
MAKTKLKEKVITGHLYASGFKKVGATEKKSAWYKKATEKPECLSKKKMSLSHVTGKS